MQHHKEQGLGFQHLVEYEDLYNRQHTNQNLPAFHLETGTIENMNMQMEFYDKYMEGVYPDQLLGGVFKNMVGEP